MKYIKIFQKQNGLVPDGIIGRKTLAKMADVFKLNNKELSHFLGQVWEETGGFTSGEESLNYSVSGLKKTFGRHRISNEDCERYGRTPTRPANQEAIANIVYGGEWGRRNLGNMEYGDGWKHRGFGSLMITGKTNQEKFANRVKDLRIIENPSLIADKYFFESGLDFFNTKNLWKYCTEVNDSSILTVSRGVNIGNPNSTGTPHGIDNRNKMTKHYYNLTKNG